MRTKDKKVAALDKALDRLRLLSRLDGARLKGQAHRVASHGMEEAAGIIGQHVADLDQCARELDEAIAQLLAVVDPSQDDTVPIGLRSTRP